ncbi:MAG: GAF domain-containing protein [Thermodesulfobacteriota bacterium]
MVRKLIYFDRLVINVKLPDDSDAFTIAHVTGLDHPDRRKGEIRSAKGTVSGEVFRSRTGLLIQPDKTPEEIARVVSRFPNMNQGFQSGFFSNIGIPLLYRDEAIGALHFRAKKVKAYTEQDLRLAGRIGAQIAGAVAHARLFGELKKAEEEQRKNRARAERLAEEMAVIARIGRIIGSNLDIDEVYERFAAEVRKFIPFDRIHVNLHDPDGESFTIAYVSGAEIARRMPGDKVSMAGTISEEVARRRTGLFLHPSTEEEIRSRFPNPAVAAIFRDGIRSIMCVPLISQGEVIGNLHFRSGESNAFDEHALSLAERIGAQIAGAIAKAGLFGDLKRAEEEQRKNRARAERLAEEMAVIAQIGRIIGSNLDIDGVYERFAAEVRKLIPFDRIHVNRHDPDGQSFTIAYVSGAEIAGRMPGDKVPMAGTISEAVCKARVGLCLHPTSEEEILARFPSSASINSFRAGMRSIMCVPLISHGEVIGNLHFRSRERNAFDEHALSLAGQIAGQIAGAIANARLFKDLKKAEEEQRKNRARAERLAEEMAIIAQIGRVIGSSLDIHEVYERFAAVARKLIPFDRIAVNPINAHEGTISFAYISGIDIHQWTPGDTMPIKGSFSEIVMQTRTGLLINTTGVDDITGRFPGLTNIHGVRSGIRSLITVPLISGGEVIAALNFRSRTYGAYGERELSLAERIGAQIAGAIANAELFKGLKKAEAALRSSEQRLTSYIEGAGDAIYVLRADTGRILDCNASACRDLGYSREELVTLSAADIETIRSSQEIEAVHGALKPGEVKTIEGFFRRKDGSVFPVEIRLSPLSPAQPELLISIVRDISERKRAQEELERYRTHLEQMVQARTEELETKNITLRELNTTLKVLLKQRDEDKRDMEERFVMNVKNLVLPFVEQMKKGRLDGGQQDCLEIVETHLNDIATPLLKSIRQFNLTPREIKVAALVRDGKSTKDIASILGIAKGSIDIHRNSIRRKLGLGSRKVNLQSYLETLDP